MSELAVVTTAPDGGEACPGQGPGCGGTGWVRGRAPSAVRRPRLRFPSPVVCVCPRELIPFLVSTPTWEPRCPGAALCVLVILVVNPPVEIGRSRVLLSFRARLACLGRGCGPWVPLCVYICGYVYTTPRCGCCCPATSTIKVWLRNGLGFLGESGQEQGRGGSAPPGAQRGQRPCHVPGSGRRVAPLPRGGCRARPSCSPALQVSVLCDIFRLETLPSLKR